MGQIETDIVERENGSPLSEALDQLLDLGFLGAISRDDLLSLKPPPRIVKVKAGETLLWQGEAGSSYYLLLRGRLRRFIEDDYGNRRFVGDVLPGQGAGASGLLTEGSQSATVRAKQDCEVVEFTRPVFLQMMVLSWEFAIGVSREQIHRVRSAAATEGQPQIAKTIAAVAIDNGVDIHAFAEKLTQSIEPLTTIALVDNHSFPTREAESDGSKQQDERGTVDLDSVISRLEAIERGHDLILYTATRHSDTWGKLVLDRADLVLLVASSDGPADLCEFEVRHILPTERELLPRMELALIHGQDWNPDCRAARWLDDRHIDEWHHLRSGNAADLQRLARVLTGNAITLVLSGGGARGLAELGVFKAIREANIPIDRVCGTSMGSLMSALIALGRSYDEATELSRKWIKKGRPGKDFTLPLTSLVHARDLHHATHEILGDGAIEDLKIPFFCLSADISENKAVVHDRGSLWRAVRASMSVPGIGPPLFENGHILVDGGTINNIPADVAAERYAGKIILVDVQIPQKMVVSDQYNDLVPSGWQILWHRINPFLKPLELPSLYDILGRSSTIASQINYRRARSYADLAIYPPTTGTTLTSFHNMDKLMKDGYDHTVAQLTGIGREALETMFPGAGPIRLQEAQMAAEPIDRALFVEILGVDDDETFQEMLGMFVDLFPEEIAALHSVAEGKDRGRVREVAHRAKSAAANVAAPDLTNLLKKIELDARAQDLSHLDGDLEQVRKEFGRIETFLRSLSVQRNTSG